MTLQEIQSTLTLFEYYKSLGEKTFNQLSDDELFHHISTESNSVGVIVKHLWGNMLSRWTNFLIEDGEKQWRERDAEFETSIKTREELMQKWEAGWNCLFKALKSINKENLDQEIYIRNQGHSINEALQRQLAHYAYHIGQIVFIGKQVRDKNWSSLSIPKNGSKAFNQTKFENKKHTEHFKQRIHS